MSNEITWLNTMPPQMAALFADKPKDVVLAWFANQFGYTEPLPSIDEFIESTDYLGEALLGSQDGVPRLGGNVYPRWRKLLREIYPNPYYSPYSEVVLSGSIGSGKSHVCKIGLLYDAYRLTKLKDAYLRYGLSKSTKIMFALINATMGLAGEVLATELWDWMNAAPKIREMLLHGQKSDPILPNRIGLIVGSRAGHTLGMAIPGCILDELNFQDKVENQALNNYTGIKRRMVSRFFHPTLGFPGRMWLASSSTLDDSFINELMAKNEANSRVKFVSHAIWEVKEHLYQNYPRFPVFVGDADKEPFIVEDVDTVSNYIDPDRIIQVPSVLKEDFESNIYKALQDLAGVSTVSNFAYINSRPKVTTAMVKPNWLDKDVISVDFFDHDDTITKKLNRHAIENRLNPRAHRFIHIDIGYANDRTGIGICHIGGFVTRKRFDPVSGNTAMSNDPWFIVDAAIAVERKPGQEVPIYKLRDMVQDLRTMGLPIGCVSTDGFQSVQMRQELQVLGFETELISLDRTIDGHQTFKMALYEQRVHLPKSELLIKELMELKFMGGKFDHPKQGSKDLSDGVIGSVQSAYLKREEYSNPLSGIENFHLMDMINDPDTYLGLDAD